MEAIAGAMEGRQDAIEWCCFQHDIVFEDYSVLKEFEPGHCVVSKKFSSGKCGWELQYFPNGVDEDNRGFASIFLRRSHGTVGNLLIETRFDIQMRMPYMINYWADSRTTPLDPSVHTFCANNPVRGFNRFQSKSHVEKEYWSKLCDNIKVRCFIWVTRESSVGVNRRVRQREESEGSDESLE